MGDLFRTLRRRLENRRRQANPLVLLYHRIADAATDPQLLCVSPRHFEEHLDVLRRSWQPTALAALAGTAAAGRPAVAVTFDDGYLDNAVAAAPLLRSRNVPATIFVTSGYVGTGREFWWDELERLLLLPGELPPCLEVPVRDDRLELAFDGDAAYTAADFDSRRAWNVADDGSPGPRQLAYRLLFTRLRPLAATEREAALDELRRAARPATGPRADHGAMDPSHVAELAADGLVEIGAHTVTHPVLAALPPELQRDEIETSKRDLEAMTGRAVTSFAYPYGTRSDVTADTLAVVQASGFSRACANVPGRFHRRTLFAIPRVIVRDWDGDEFARHLETA